MHNQLLLEMLDTLTRRAQVQPADFAVVAFGAGPGSFTGVRIAAAVAQSIALVADALVVPVASSRAMLAASGLQSGQVVTVTRSRGDAYYLAGYRGGDDGWELVLPDALHTQWPRALRDEGWVAVGDHPPWQEAAEVPQWRGEVRVDASHIAELGVQGLQANEGRDPADGLPRYVSGDTPWQAR